MTADTRYRLWIGCVVWAAVVDPLAIVLTRLGIPPFVNVWPAASSDAAFAPSFAVGVIGAGTLAMALLILTTPPDARRLPVSRSLTLIGLLTAWVFGWSGACYDASPPPGIGAAVLPLTAVALATTFAWRGLTPWWAAVLLWQPAAIGPTAFAWPWVVAAAVLLVAAFRRPAFQMAAS